jgi:hypothetical protein
MVTAPGGSVHADTSTPGPSGALTLRRRTRIGAAPAGNDHDAAGLAGATGEPEATSSPTRGRADRVVVTVEGPVG